MEFLILVCSSTLQENVTQLLEDLAITGFTTLPHVTGAGTGGGTRLNDEVWPGENCLVLMAVSAAQAAAVMDWARAYRQGARREGLKVFSLALKDMT